MRVYDLCSGCGGFSEALRRSKIPGHVVLWSEIDKPAIQTYLKNFPNHTGLNVGDLSRAVFDLDRRSQWVTNEFRVQLMPPVDMILSGTPCQDLSIARGKREGIIGDKSSLFFAFSEIVRIKKPKYFLLENVASMSTRDRDIISTALNVEAREINSKSFTGQKRRRLYWFNWDADLNLPDGGPKMNNLIAWSSSRDYDKKGQLLRTRARETKDGYANTLTTGRGCGNRSSQNFIKLKRGRRILTPAECEILQGFPVGWTEGVSETQRYRQSGNAITVPVVEFLLNNIKKD